MKPPFHQYIDNKQAWLSADLIAKIDNYLKITPDEVYELSINGVKSKRSNAQNRLYWGAIIDGFLNIAASLDCPAMKFSDWTAEDFHSVLKEKFLRKYDDKLKRIVTQSTTALSVEEMSKYIDQCIDFLVSKGGVIHERHKELYNQSKGEL